MAVVEKNEATEHAAFAELSLEAIFPTSQNPRLIDTESPAFQELVASIAEHGVLEPILVRPMSDELLASYLGDGVSIEGGDGLFYELRAGERRWRAAQAAGHETIPAIIREMDDKAALMVTVTENMHREDLNPLEESAGVASLMDSGWTIEDVADSLGKSVSWVKRRASLRNLSPSWVSVAVNELAGWKAGHWALVARLPSKAQEAAFIDIPRFCGGEIEDLLHTPVREVRVWLSRYMRLLSNAPWDLDDETLSLEEGPCSACPHRSSCQGDLFESDEQAHCLLPDCWDSKMIVRIETLAASAVEDGRTVYLLHDYTLDKPEHWLDDERVINSYQVDEVYEPLDGDPLVPGATWAFVIPIVGENIGLPCYGLTDVEMPEDGGGDDENSDSSQAPMTLAERVERLPYEFDLGVRELLYQRVKQIEDTPHLLKFSKSARANREMKLRIALAAYLFEYCANEPREGIPYCAMDYEGDVGTKELWSALEALGEDALVDAVFRLMVCLLSETLFECPEQYHAALGLKTAEIQQQVFDGMERLEDMTDA